MLREGIIQELRSIVGDEDILTDREDLESYSYDATTTWAHVPDVVVFPTSTEEVSKILKLANENLIPVTPRGSGTNVSGGSVPIMGGIVLCTARMNRIIEINKENLVAVVEPGVVLQDFNTALAKEGLFYPPDPQSFLAATIGGTVAENAGGPAGVKYGVTKHYVLGLEVVLADGSVVNLGGITSKNVTGYDLPMLFTGSEGTLGVITKITLRLLPKPPFTKTLMAVYSDLTIASDSVHKVLSAGIVPSKIELLDNWVIRSIEEMMSMGLPTDADAILLFECDGIRSAVEEEIRHIESVCKEGGAVDVRVAETQEEADKYWLARRAGFAAVFRKAPTVLAEDVTVPRDKIPMLVSKCKELSKKYDVEVVIIGHAGDGNLHPSILTNIQDREHYERATSCMHDIIEYALEIGGVLSGEHGIGLEKKKFLAKAMDPKAIEILRSIKRVLDPNNILNPGKIWED